MKPRWDALCSQILARMAWQYRDSEIAAWIEHETGKRFSERTVRRNRELAGIPCCRRDRPLKRANLGFMVAA